MRKRAVADFQEKAPFWRAAFGWSTITFSRVAIWRPASYSNASSRIAMTWDCSRGIRSVKHSVLSPVEASKHREMMAMNTMAKRRTTSIAGKAPDNIGILILPARAASPQPASVNAVPTDVFRQPLCPAGVVHQHRPPKDIAPDHDAVRAECAPQFIAQVATACGLAARMSLIRQKALRPDVSTWH